MKFPSFSLRAALTIPYVVLTLVLAVAISLISYWAGKSAVEQLSDRLLVDIVQRVSQAVDRHLVGSRVALEAVLPQAGGAHVQDIPPLAELERRMSIATALHTNPNNYVYYGNRQGQFVGVNRLDASSVEVRLKTESGKAREFFRVAGGNSTRQLTKTEATVYEPRDRPWYKTAVDQRRPAWAPVYVDFFTGDLVTTRSTPILNANKEVEGVIGTDVSLKKLSEFVSQLAVPHNGVLIIVESNGNLIASSTGEPLFVGNGNSKRRVNAVDSTNELVRGTYNQFASLLTSDQPVNTPFTAEFSTSQGAVIASLDSVRDDAGLRWFALVAVPRSQVLDGVSSSLVRAGLVGLVAAALALMVGLWILSWVARDLKLLTEATKRIREGHVGESLAIYRHDEIGDLARSFEKMHIDLQVDELTGVYNRETFVRLLDRTIREMRDGGGMQNFSVLFIDMDKFKAVNDELGHLAGDKMLKLVADRLRNAVRAGDIVARYGGDEFVIMLKDIGLHATAKSIAAKIHDSMAPPVDGLRGLDGNPVSPQVSIGIALFPLDGSSVEDLIRLADKRMYAQKRRAA
jgi:diguanylate cyclase (GGDEF)-like protein